MQSLKIMVILLVVFAANAADDPGFIRIKNLADYSIEVKLEYYNANGFESSTGSTLSSPGNSVNSINDGATNISFKVSALTPDGSKTNLISQIFPHPVQKCYTFSGTMVKPEWSELKCQ